MNLTNTAIAQLFTIQQGTWTTINTRVGFIIYLNQLANTSGGDFMIPWPDNNTLQLLQNLSGQNNYSTQSLLIGIKSNNTNNVPSPDGQTYLWSDWVIDTNVSTILPACQSWSSTTYNSLIGLATQIQTYANNSANSFSELNQQINNSDGVVSSALQQTTANIINALAQSTSTLVADTNVIFNELRDFLSANKAFDNFLTTNNFLVPLMNIQQVTPAQFSSFEIAIETVVGTWGAITSSIGSSNCTPAQVDNTFLESLNINVAINQWNEIAAATANFISFAGNQSQYWNYRP